MVRRRPATPGQATGTLVTAPSPVPVDVPPDGPDDPAVPVPLRPARARRVAVLAVTVVVLAGLVAWPRPDAVPDPRGDTARGDAARTGVVSQTSLPPPVRVRWSHHVGTVAGLTVVAAGDDVVVEHRPDGLLAVREADSGDVRWLRRDGAAGTTLTAGDVVAQQDHATGTVRAYDLASGQLRWELPAPVGGLPLAALPDGALLLRAGGPDTLTAVDAATGEARWRLDLRDRLGASLVRTSVGADGIVLWATTPFGLDAGSPSAGHLAVRVDPTDGRVVWVQEDLPLGGHLPWNPILLAGDVAVVAGPRSVHTIDHRGRRGHELYAGPPLRAAAATDGLVVLDLGAEGLQAVDVRTGEPRWRRADLGAGALVGTPAGVLVVRGATTTVLDGRDGTTVAVLDAPVDADVGPEPSGLLAAAGDTRATVVDHRTGRRSTWPLLRSPLDPAALADGRLYLGRPDGIEVRDLDDGEVVWSFGELDASFRHVGATPVRTPAVAGPTVVVSPGGSPGGGGHGLVALERTGGVLAWDRHGDAPAVRGPLTLADDVVYVPVGDEVHGYDVATGRRAFAAVAGTPRGPLVVSPSRVIGGPARTGAVGLPAGASGGGSASEAVAILRRDRSVAWRAPLDPCSGPALGDDVVVWGTSTGVTALAETTGERRWERPTALPVCLDPVVLGDLVVVVEDPATVRGLARTSGDERWTTTLNAPVVASPVAAGDTLLVPTLDGRLVGLDAGDGTRRWTHPLGSPAAASPTVAGDRIVVLLVDGRLVALEG